jgi:hypothetical protein
MMDIDSYIPIPVTRGNYLTQVGAVQTPALPTVSHSLLQPRLIGVMDAIRAIDILHNEKLSSDMILKRTI